MGCLQSKDKDGDSGGGAIKEEAPKKVDPRLPFENYRQLFNMKNSWKTVSRSMESVAKDNLARFFKQHPQHKALHKNLAKMTDEEKMYGSQAFEDSAMAVFTVIDAVLEKADGKVDEAISSLERAGRMHSKIKDFKPEYFNDMEDSFVQACGECLGDRFTDATENNFRLLYKFSVQHIITGYNAAVAKLAAAQGGQGNRI